jgi:chaperonin GroEL (HSP60 family)
VSSSLFFSGLKNTLISLSFQPRPYFQGGLMIGIDGETGKLVDMKEAGILDSFAVKQQVMRASIETAAMLLRIDQIVSGISHGKKAKMGEQQQQAAKKDDDEDEEIKPLQQLKR